MIGVFQKERDSKTLREEAEVQLKELEKREVALRARIATLETERGQEAALRDAYKILYRSGLRLEVALSELSGSAARFTEVQQLCNFIRQSERGIIR